MPKLCGLTITGSSATPVCVNPMAVRYVRSTGSIIFFESDGRLNVVEPFEQVRGALDRAMNDT